MNVKYCPKCQEYYGGGVFKMCEECLYCKGDLVELNIDKDNFNILYKISSDNNFLQAMIDLKDKDPIEFQLKMSQFRTQVNQTKAIEEQKQNANVPKCPTCGSTNIEKISFGKKAFGGALFGIFSSDVRKTMHCKNCGYKW